MISREPGAVFAYPYLWYDERDKMNDPKDRVTCLSIVRKTTTAEGATLIHLFLLGISDNPRDGQIAMEVPTLEKRRAGLDADRPAFVVTSEYNYDVLPMSWHYDRNSKTYGRFSKPFTDQVKIAFLTNIKGGLSRRSDRTSG